ncbi:hypothetical protein [Rhodococcus sp. 14-2483-1-2]|uniref:hypothetical protein n=1 Tax=Rhodococcus sp. 14-2483-1-2 TaxID=2023147 RepID=UPI000B9A458E|nr:hypothetical protein [Rhodococcus sp. 14-2483-1-2]OZF29444.1 hypothetical protein CH295_18060 [Rhodococcus sp. 14-2483-1-2]
MGDNQDSTCELFYDLQKIVEYYQPDLVVERAERFGRENEIGFHGQAACDGYALAQKAGESWVVLVAELACPKVYSSF